MMKEGEINDHATPHQESKGNFHCEAHFVHCKLCIVIIHLGKLLSRDSSWVGRSSLWEKRCLKEEILSRLF